MPPLPPTHVPKTIRPRAGHGLAIVGTACAVAIAAIAERWPGLGDLSPIFMLTVLLVASRTRPGPAVATAVLCFLAYNFFFIEPRFTFYISARDGVATVIAFLAAALVTARLAARLSMQIAALRTAAGYAAARQALAERLAAAVNEQEVIVAMREVFRERLGADAEIASADTGGPVDDHDGPGDGPIGAPQLRWELPLRSGTCALGTLHLRMPAGADVADGSLRALAESMVDDVAQALLRTRLAAELQSQRVAAETERLRNALLSSVSHDLRSPLAAIIGCASSLEHYGERMSADDRGQMLGTIRTEGERLDRYIQNLLDMTRLGHGGLSLQRDWIGVDELVGAAVGRIRAFLPQAHVALAPTPGLAPLWVHPAMVEQALFNVIENAVKFSPTDATVRVGYREDADASAVVFEIDDRGPGIPDADRSRIFDMFYTVGRGDRGRHGTGLGLTIAQGMIGAHGGRIEALPGPEGRGTRIRIVLPRMEPPETDP